MAGRERRFGVRGLVAAVRALGRKRSTAGPASDAPQRIGHRRHLRGRVVGPRRHGAGQRPRPVRIGLGPLREAVQVVVGELRAVPEGIGGKGPTGRKGTARPTIRLSDHSVRLPKNDRRSPESFASRGTEPPIGRRTPKSCPPAGRTRQMSEARHCHVPRPRQSATENFP